MRFSVLLPTRNRLELLKSAIFSVTEQEYDDWEIIVSDNYSEQDVKGYIDSLNDERIKYFRTKEAVSVTENWNNAVEKCTGDYVIMLGDDDCIMKGYFKIMKDIISQFSSPDFIYSNGFLFAYPETLPSFPHGLTKFFANCDLWDKQEPYLLSKNKQRELVQGAMNFKVVFCWNMQFATISRQFLQKLKFAGNFFHSPFPDYYSMTLMMMQAESVVACPYPVVTIGISKKSHGYYYFNNREEEGVRMLNIEDEMNQFPEVQKFLLPGPKMNDSWLFSYQAIKRNLASLKRIKVKYSRYRLLQVMDFYNQIKDTRHRKRKLLEFAKHLRLWEKIVYGSLIQYLHLVELKKGRAGRNKKLVSLTKRVIPYQAYGGRIIDEQYTDIKDVFSALDPLTIER